MITPSNSTPRKGREPFAHRLTVVALLATVVTLLVAAVYPSGKPADELTELSFGATYGWLAAQSLILTLPGLMIGMLIGKILPRTGAVLGAAFIFSVPVVVLCDAMAFTWIAERFLSGTMGRIATTLLPSLMLHVSSSMAIAAVTTVASGIVLICLIWWVAGVAGRRWQAQEDSIQPLSVIVVMASLAAFLSTPAAMNLSRTMSEMARASARHPFCAFHIVGYRGVGVQTPQDGRAVLARLRGLYAAPAVQHRDQQQKKVSVDKQGLQAASGLQSDPGQQKATDVIIVVIECLRPELIDPKIMPNLHAFAEKSVYCPRNFSSGNATCYGVFGLMTGLEAIWFHRPVSEQPLLNRLLHESGYEIGFYGGQTDWRHFDMDGFVQAKHYDDFQIELPDLPDSDLRTVERAVKFIEHGTGKQSDDPAAPPPRASVAYMFATHSRFSYPEDQIFQPTVPDEHLLTLNTPEMREQFYNRFKNSARTMDRLIEPLLRDDCVVIILGDHGEPFFEDGTKVHGTRLSQYQNMTPAVIHYPGVSPRKINSPTLHADLLPTLVSILGIPLTDPDVFDGVDLLNASEEMLAGRSFVTCNYMDMTSLLVGPWTFDSAQPFGYRVVFEIKDWQSCYLNPVDELGYAWEETPDHDGKERFKQWVINRFGAESFNESTSEQELFTKFLRSTDRETRFSALKIAGDVMDLEDYLYRLIAEATRDRDPEIRAYAKDLVIRINRFRGNLETKK